VLEILLGFMSFAPPRFARPATREIEASSDRRGTGFAGPLAVPP